MDIDVYIPGLPPIADPAAHPKVTLSRIGGPTITVPIADPEIRVGNFAADWQPIDRPGDAMPLLGLRGRRLTPIDLKFVIDEDVLDRLTYGQELNQTTPGYPANLAEACLGQINQLAAPGPPVVVGYGNLTAGLWRITTIEERTLKLAPTDNHVLRAEVTMTLTRASDPPPISRAPAAPPPAPPPAAAPPPPAAVRTYTVKAGDTLWEIAARTYGNGNEWRRIADANGVRDPRRLRIGQVLTIP